MIQKNNATLTNKRIIVKSEGVFNSSSTEIPLRNIDSIESHFNVKVSFLIVGVIFSILGIIMFYINGNFISYVVLFLISFIFIVLLLVSIKSYIFIYSNSNVIGINKKGMKKFMEILDEQLYS